MGVSPPSISSWEKGRARPKRGRMAKLATILGVPISDLLDDAPPEGLQELIGRSREQIARAASVSVDRRSEEHTSELQSLMSNQYAVFCLKNTTKTQIPYT